jgi:hypothetical protein
VSHKGGGRESLVSPHSETLASYLEETLFETFELFMEASLVKVFTCAKFQIEIRKHDFCETWGPIGNRHNIPYVFVYKWDEILLNQYQGRCILLRSFHFIMFPEWEKLMIYDHPLLSRVECCQQRANRTGFCWFEFGSVRLHFWKSGSSSVRFDSSSANSTKSEINN